MCEGPTTPHYEPTEGLPTEQPPPNAGFGWEFEPSKSMQSTNLARRFYLHFGFRSLKDDDRHRFLPNRFLPMSEIRKLKLEPLS